jgi:hypothetical protein
VAFSPRPWLPRLTMVAIFLSAPVELDLDLDPFSSVLVAEHELERFRAMATGGVVVRKKSCMVTNSRGSCVPSRILGVGGSESWSRSLRDEEYSTMELMSA